MSTVAVFGAGAVGCWFGGLLAHAGHDVTLIGRDEHVRAVRADGLRMTSAGSDEHVRCSADVDPAAVAGADVVLCCVKATSIDEAGAAMAPHLAPATTMLALQNGVGAAERLAQLVGVAVVPVVAYVAVEMTGPGHVSHHGRGELVIGPGEHADRVVELFAGSRAEVRVTAGAEGERWAKLVVNCALNAVSALTGRPYGELWARPGVADAVRGVVDECLAVAAAAGVDVGGDPWATVLSVVDTMPTQRSSTAQDLAAGRATEIDHLNGFVVRTGSAHGVATPRNELLRALVRAAEHETTGEHGR
ncbi:ketopantoate reductase family protein [Ilumatobacter sp.]|uniref:ketopantoate reductase family protein n=1 Tax=Ilumatobacter sp. TaxID=1967498 RepID=UPI003B51A6CF